MKKAISIILIVTTLLSAVLAMAGCNLIFNDGSEDEVAGIYGFTKMQYRHRIGTLSKYEQYDFNYADKYDYYIVVLFDDKTGAEYIKPVDGDEVKYEFTYSLIFDNEDTDVVEQIVLQNFVMPVYTFNEQDKTCTMKFESVATQAFKFYPKSEYFSINASGSATRDFLKFNKISSATSDKKLERAKAKQIKALDDRKSSSDAEE